MAKGKTIHFLITYDRSKLCVVDMERFRNGTKAVDRYEQLEHLYADQAHVEVVLLGADSEEAIRVTHSHYFRDCDAEPLTLEEFSGQRPWLTPEPASG